MQLDLGRIIEGDGIMAYNKRNWKARQGTGLNFFSIDGATPVPIVNQPTTLTEAGDALSAGNLNDWEQRIADGFDSASGELADAVEELESEDTALRSAITANSNRIANLEQKAGDYSIVQYRGTNAVPTGKAKYGLVKSIVGKSRAWNQLVNTLITGTSVVGGVTVNVESTSFTINSGTGSSSESLPLMAGIPITKGHKFLLFGCFAQLYVNNQRYENYGDTYASTWDSGGVYTAGETGEIRIQCYIRSGITYTTKKYVPKLYDLTIIFGAGNEPSTVADAIAQLPALGQDNAYDAGSLVDTVVSGVKSVGFNILDELAYYNEVGAVKDSDGYYTATANDWHDHIFNEIKFKSNMVYNFHLTVKNNGVGNPQLAIYYTDGTTRAYYFESGDGTYDKLSASGKSIDFFMMSYGSGSTNTYGVKDFCINLSQPNTSISPHNGEYYPYKTDTLSLSTPVTLRSAGSVAGEQDVESGVIMRKVRKKTYNDSSEVTDYSGSYTNVKFYLIPKPSDSTFYNGDILGNGLASKFELLRTVPTLDSTDSVGKILCGYSLTHFFVGFVAGTTLAQAQEALSTLSLNYELATPYTESIDPVPDNTLYTEGGGTIETIQTQSPVIDNCLDVGYLAV